MHLKRIIRIALFEELDHFLNHEHLPWISGAWTAGREKDFLEPGYNGTSERPMASSTLPAFAVVLARDELPWIVVMPSSFKDGWWAAIRIANTSCSLKSDSLEHFYWAGRCSAHIVT
jgi:hypothetical protein